MGNRTRSSMRGMGTNDPTRRILSESVGQMTDEGNPCLVWLGVAIGLIVVGLVMASGRRKP